MKTRPQSASLRHPLRLWRENHKPALLLEDAAEALDTSTVSISRIERGLQRPGPELEDRIVRKTRISRDELARAYRALRPRTTESRESVA
jgi:transcriptional regulator with XRE-family HTH domain